MEIINEDVLGLVFRTIINGKISDNIFRECYKYVDSHIRFDIKYKIINSNIDILEDI